MAMPHDKAPADDGTIGSARLTRRGFLRKAAGGAAVVAAGAAGAWWWLLRGTLPTSTPSALQQLAGASSPPSAPPRASATPTPADAPSLESLPGARIPVFTPVVLRGERADGLLLLTPSEIGVVMCEDDGNAVLVHPAVKPGTFAYNARIGVYRGRPSISYWEGAIVAGEFPGEFVVLDDSYAEVARVTAGEGMPADIHEFLFTERDTALLLAYQIPDFATAPDGSPELVDCLLREIDIATGAVLFEWRASDHVGADESYLAPKPGTPYDYFHANSIDVDKDGDFILSARNTCAVYKIDHRTGNLIWRLSGKRSDFAMGPSTRFAWQHDARRRPDGMLTIFDDGSSGGDPPTPPTEKHSRGLVLALDEKARTCRLAREYVHPSILSTSQGSMQALPNGNVLVGWGNEPRFTEFDRAGTIVLDGLLPHEGSSYRALRFPWRGRPAQPPAVAVEVYAASLTVRVSWNGATDVASWQVLGGDDPNRLLPLGTAARVGWETLIHVPGRPTYVAIRAIGRDGATLTETAPQAG